jgi:ion channel POLLUX/CASTOR
LRRITLSQRLRYQFDNTMSRGPVALIGWLFLASAAMIVLVTLVALLAGIGPREEDGTRSGFLDTLWFGLMRTLDAGTMGGDTGPWSFLFVGLAITFGGIFVVSTLIGVLTSGIEGKLDELRKGRSFVVESGHTVILGWSPQVFAIVSELVQANANQKRSCIVILADRDKVEMEDDLRARVPETRNTRIVCRSGNPMDLADLEIVNPHASKAILILAPPGDDPDSHVVKTILALTNNPQRRSEPYHIVAQIRDPRNLEVARMVGRDEAQLLLTGDLISRIAVQTSRQSGLSVVYTELLDFAGDEIYFQEEPRLVGSTFGAALLAYDDSAVIGLQIGTGSARQVTLNPPMETVINPGDRIIAISRDDDTVRLNPHAASIDEHAIRTVTPRPQMPERSIVLGWNRRTPAIINELDGYVAPGSQVTLVTDSPDAEAAIASECASLRNTSVTVQQGDTTDRRLLEALDIHTFDHVLVLSYSDILDAQEADARTLITLLHLRDMAERGGYTFSIVSEMLDVRNRDLAQVTRADDFIVSDTLVSLLFAQIAENRDLAAVFEDLFDAEGMELYLKPASDYVATDTPLNFYTVVESARRRGEVAIGYRQKRASATSSFGVVVNPTNSQMLTLGAEDRVIVVAEN